MNIFKILVVASALLAPASALAEVTLWKKVGGWDISFYPNTAGCQAFTRYEAGTAFFIGFTRKESTHYLDVTLMDPAWASIEAGKEYDIKAFFGDETPWNLDMTGQDYGGTPGLNGNFDLNDAELLVEEFQRELAMEWTYKDFSLGRYTLRGSRRAFQEVLNCQRSYNDAISSVDDPFATGASSSSDPFSQ